MDNQKFQQVMDRLMLDEEQKLGVNSPEFMKKHIEIMEGCDKQNELLHDLMDEQREGM